MSGRKLGGGRVLGNGRSLSPAYPPRNSSLLSPSASTVSVSSSASTQPSTDAQDISSRISLDQSDGSNGAAAAATANSRLVCPICNEEMVTLLQLNRHLDDTHKNLEEVKQNEAKDWFKTQMTKAKRFQPLAVLNQKFKGLDVFDSENDPPRSPSLQPVTVSAASTPLPTQPDPDDVVTKAHWQRHGLSDACSEPECGKRLNSASGIVNCRSCGKLFCDEHTMYKMKLSRSAHHEPVRGLWCRVCETCYKSREGYNDRTGLERDHTADFQQLRRKTVDKTLLEISRLEKRLTRLTQLLANPPEQTSSPGSLIWPLAGAKSQRKQLEQSVVDWEDDAIVSMCPFCQQEFSNYTFRRHHCRICGRVVCGDPLTDCSNEIGLNVATTVDSEAEKIDGQIGIDIRMCRDCKTTIFSRGDFQESLVQRSPDVRAYENLVQFERGIRLMLPKFQRLLVVLQDPDRPPTPVQLSEASRTRKRLVDAFGQYNTAARRIRDLPTESPTQQKLQQAIYQQSTNFLQLHMLPLKALPKVLKHATPNGIGSPGRSTPNVTQNGKPTSALASIRYNDIDNASQVSSSSAVSALEAEEKTLRETLIVLEEQLFLVKEQVADANKRRKFDEVSSLAQNVDDLSREIDQVQGQLGQLDFASAYGAQSPRIIPNG
ncbi:carboxypeptidase Y-deficient [Lecanora helva]